MSKRLTQQDADTARETLKAFARQEDEAKTARRQAHRLAADLAMSALGVERPGLFDAYIAAAWEEDRVHHVGRGMSPEEARSYYSGMFKHHVEHVALAFNLTPQEVVARLTPAPSYGGAQETTR